MSLLEIQDPSLYAEGVWAHPTAALERGGVLIASNEAADILGDDRWWQLVILIISHDASGTVGLILNRPSSLQFGRKKGGLPFVVQVRG